jgi:oligopeptide transport system ATP-binding protein
MAEPVLRIQDLRTQFFTQDGVVTAINGLSMDVAPGEIVGVVGESGSGKSTLALSIMRLLPNTGRVVSGQIVFGGQDIARLGNRQMRALRGRRIAMVFQDSLAALDPTMKIGKQIGEAITLHLDLSPADARKRAVELLDMVGIPGAARRMDDYPHQFSGGMRQRVMIATALSCDPTLLIADEPTTALDVTIQRQIIDLLLDMRQRTGIAIIMITHDVGVVAQMCDQVVVMYAGQKIESGPTETVFTRPRHPYTIGLLGSSLDLEHDRHERLKAIPGLPPDLTGLTIGCPFAPRCDRRLDTCLIQNPPLITVGVNHVAACWNMDHDS